MTRLSLFLVCIEGLISFLSLTLIEATGNGLEPPTKLLLLSLI